MNEITESEMIDRWRKATDQCLDRCIAAKLRSIGLKDYMVIAGRCPCEPATDKDGLCFALMENTKKRFTGGQ